MNKQNKISGYKTQIVYILSEDKNSNNMFLDTRIINVPKDRKIKPFYKLQEFLEEFFVDLL